MFSDLEKKLVKELQDGLPLVGRPFLALARRLNLSEDEVIGMVRSFIEKGVIRRFGAAVRHQDLGYVSNVMVVWKVPSNKVGEVGRRLAELPQVSHCYQRPTSRVWPYNIFTVMHGHTKQECIEAVQNAAKAVEIDEYELLFSTAELKKSSMKYFLEED